MPRNTGNGVAVFVDDGYPRFGLQYLDAAQTIDGRKFPAIESAVGKYAIEHHTDVDDLVWTIDVPTEASMPFYHVCLFDTVMKAAYGNGPKPKIDRNSLLPAQSIWAEEQERDRINAAKEEERKAQVASAMETERELREMAREDVKRTAAQAKLADARALICQDKAKTFPPRVAQDVPAITFPEGAQVSIDPVRPPLTFRFRRKCQMELAFAQRISHSSIEFFEGASDIRGSFTFYELRMRNLLGGRQFYLAIRVER